ncbi:MAG TPA: GNAT family N-acetyltransferase [Actinomycetota bacterium]|nr:GNAT family N-acetyltransferase [Actinomycetota bacterium]
MEAVVDDEFAGGLPLYLAAAPSPSPYDPSESLAGVLGGPVEEPLHPFVLGGGRLGFRSQLLLPDALPAARGEVATRIVEEMERQARRWGARGCGLMYLTDGAAAEASPVLTPRGYVVYLETFEARLAVQWRTFDEYLGSFSRDRRNAIKREIGRFERSGLSIEPTRQAGLENVMARLLANVQRRYGSAADEGALEKSLRLASEEANRHSVAFVLNNDDAVIGYCLAYRWGRHLFLRSAGFDYDDPSVRGAYFPLVLYAPLQYAIENDLEQVHLGTEAFEAKVTRGGRLFPLWSAVFLEEGEGLFRRRLDDAARARFDALREANTYPPLLAAIDDAQRAMPRTEPAWTSSS